MDRSLHVAISDLITHMIQGLGCNLLEVKVSGNNVKTVEVIIDKDDNTNVSIADCAKVSKCITPIIDVSNVFNHNKYHLHVSSGGLERALYKISDYLKFIDKSIVVKLKEKVNGLKEYTGVIVSVEESDISLKCKIKEQDMTVVISFGNIRNARLVFTDEMFKKLLKNKTQNTI